MDQILAYQAKHTTKKGAGQEVGTELNTSFEAPKQPRKRNKEAVKEELIHTLDRVNIFKKFYELVKEMRKLEKEHKKLQQEFDEIKHFMPELPMSK
ncbi:MAG: hypothetical protein NT085_02210 [candidate division SR1 bacterium]|nr:hypothetical protein [candidate division SR1 bacterium]